MAPPTLTGSEKQIALAVHTRPLAIAALKAEYARMESLLAVSQSAKWQIASPAMLAAIGSAESELSAKFWIELVPAAYLMAACRLALTA